MKTARFGLTSLILCAAIVAVAWPGPAFAQRKLTGDPSKDFAMPNSGFLTKAPPILSPSDAVADLSAQIEKVKVDTINGIVGALQEADADAATLTNPQDQSSFKDPIAHACYPAQIKFLQSIPAATPIQAPAPYNLIVLFQRKRDFVAQVRAGLPVYLKIGCAPLLGDEASIFVQTMAMAGVKIGLAGITGAFPALAPITLPALSIAP